MLFEISWFLLFPGQKDKLDFMVDIEEEEKKNKTRRKENNKTAQKKDQFM